jgi:hypothetical protein
VHFGVFGAEGALAPDADFDGVRAVHALGIGFQGPSVGAVLRDERRAVVKTTLGMVLEADETGGKGGQAMHGKCGVRNAECGFKKTEDGLSRPSGWE